MFRVKPNYVQVAARPFVSAYAVALLATATAAVQAQSDAAPETGGQRGVAIVPTFSAEVTATDNVNLGATNRRSDLITQLSPGIQASSNAGRIKGFLNYSLNVVAYAHESESNEIQHALNAAASIEAAENWAFVDLAASISQQAISAFGTQSSSNTSINANRTSVSTFSISPYLRGRISDIADYEARVSYTDLADHGEVVTNAVKDSEAFFRVGEEGGGRRPLGWSAEISRRSFDYDPGSRVSNDRLHGSLTYLVSPELRLSVLGGRESQDIAGAVTQSSSTSGWGVDWTPGERTRLSATSERRFFGNSHAVSFEHRTPHTVWKYSDTRGLSTDLAQPRSGSRGTAFDLFFTQFASVEPDPVARAGLVNLFLQKNGIAPNTVVLGGALASATLVERRQDFSFAWVGLRDTLTIELSQSEGERADQVANVIDDFANGNQVRERGLGVSLAHRLSPLSSLSIAARLQSTSGTVDPRTSMLRAFWVTWTSRLAAHTNVSISGRQSHEDGLNPYTESALIATVSLQF